MTAAHTQPDNCQPKLKDQEDAVDSDEDALGSLANIPTDAPEDDSVIYSLLNPCQPEQQEYNPEDFLASWLPYPFCDLRPLVRLS